MAIEFVKKLFIRYFNRRGKEINLIIEAKSEPFLRDLIYLTKQYNLTIESDQGILYIRKKDGKIITDKDLDDIRDNKKSSFAQMSYTQLEAGEDWYWW